MTFQPVGLYRVDALGLLQQLAREKVVDFTATEDDAADIVTALLALQENPNPISEGTVTISGTRSLTIPYDSILGAIERLHESVGGYYWVDSSRAFHWTPDIGEDTGQMLRFGRNLTSIRLTSDFSELRNRLYCYGAGEGEARVRLGKGAVLLQPQASTDLAMKAYDDDADEWVFWLGSAAGPYARKLEVGWVSTTVKKYGAAVRFPGVAIPQGATIEKAELRLTAHASPGSGDNVDSKVYTEAADDAAAFSNLTDYDARSAGTKVDWLNVASWSALQVYAKDITTQVQEVINRAGWASGNALVVFWEDHDGRSTIYHSRKSYLTYADEKSPTLYIEFTIPGSADYIEDEASQELYGFHCGPPLVDLSITDPATLFEWAVRQLEELAYPHVSYAAAAADLSALGYPLDEIILGNTVRILDSDIGIDAKTRIVKLVQNLLQGADIQVELSNRARTVLDKLAFAKDPRWRVHFY